LFESASTLLEKRAHVAFKEELVGQRPEEAKWGSIGEVIHHDRSSGFLSKRVAVHERLECTADHLVLEDVGRGALCDSGREALHHAEVRRFPRHFVALPEQAADLASDRTLPRL
jgi:hypothetical protein